MKWSYLTISKEKLLNEIKTLRSVITEQENEIYNLKDENQVNTSTITSYQSKIHDLKKRKQQCHFFQNLIIWKWKRRSFQNVIICLRTEIVYFISHFSFIKMFYWSCRILFKNCIRHDKINWPILLDIKDFARNLFSVGTLLFF